MDTVHCDRIPVENVRVAGQAIAVGSRRCSQERYGMRPIIAQV